MFRFFIYRTIMTLSSSVRHWNSTVNIGRGFLSQVLEKLQQVPDENKDCALRGSCSGNRTRMRSIKFRF